ncbi:MAG: hypothetical protein MHM6MM_001040 [Cercozoa sp. M6MM]
MSFPFVAAYVQELSEDDGVPSYSFKQQHDTEVKIRACSAELAEMSGGFGGVPGNEAHGGYAFCGTAALALMGALELVDVKRLMRWTVRRQMRLEGGFQGRVNKLVDACYSYWVGAIMAIVHPTSSEVSSFDWAFDRLRLQEYLLASSQCGTGGMRDKPPMRSDMYHTCYALAGLSIAQNASDCQVLGVTENALVPINPVLNLVDRRVESAQRFFLA